MEFDCSSYEKLWADGLSDLCSLEKINTIHFAASFDLVLGKPGLFVPFSVSNIAQEVSVHHDQFGNPKF